MGGGGGCGWRGMTYMFLISNSRPLPSRIYEDMLDVLSRWRNNQKSLASFARVLYIVDYLGLTLPAPARLLGGTPSQNLPSPSHLRRLMDGGMGHPVLPTGRNFGRKTQKWPYKNMSGRKNSRPNFL
jgi:hypothetical protein